MEYFSGFAMQFLHCKLERFDTGFVGSSFLSGYSQSKVDADRAPRLFDYVVVDVRDYDQPGFLRKPFQGGSCFCENGPFRYGLGELLAVAITVLNAESVESLFQAEAQYFSVTPVGALNQFELDIFTGS